MIVLGVDGMDPVFVEQHWSELPNLDRLRRQGGFRRLGTTTPPQSPVAWATFITGLAPSAHGLFDFVHRDPATLEPFSSMGETEPPRHTLSFGSWVIPLSKPRIRTFRRGRAFWEILVGRSIPVAIVRMPTNYRPIPAGEALAGMGTPDLQGTLGTFSFYTANPGETSRPVAGGRLVKITPVENRAVLQIEGPPNSLRKGQPTTTADLIVDSDPDEAVVRLRLGDSLTILKQGEWSPWLVAEFPLVRHLVNVRGMFRVYLKQVHPWLELYVSPTNADPRSPELPLSAPADYSRDVAAAIGPFYTQGIAEDTAALREGVFSLSEFLEQSKLVLDDERRLLRYSLDHYRGGLLFVYFSAIDQNSHMLWGRHEEELSRVYREIDDAVGETMEKANGADVIVMSDHGFTSFDRAVNLNAWLAREGFLIRTASLDIDWPHTQAYAMGLNGLYVNLAGREKNGFVQASSRQMILEKIREGLLALRDPWNGHAVVESASIEPPDRANAATTPDMIVGYAPRYRGSWETALGGAPEPMIYDNIDAWIGDHCINAADVPGVLFANRNITAENPVIRDLTVSILRLFGASPGPGMDGKEVF
ncbi:MAG TPA: alkaline phosphatase family protein [Bryobacteraceae bacterium]|nr:alkaline phosphatase family protein [Bryobacteraceae bacterium]